MEALQKENDELKAQVQSLQKENDELKDHVQSLQQHLQDYDCHICSVWEICSGCYSSAIMDGGCGGPCPKCDKCPNEECKCDPCEKCKQCPVDCRCR